MATYHVSLIVETPEGMSEDEVEQALREDADAREWELSDVNVVSA